MESTRVLSELGHDYAICYENPNIHPAGEYERRLDALREYVTEPQGIELFEGDYTPEEWERVAGVHGNDRKRRCRACYRLRFERVAAKARELGCEGICTTLTISPYQFTDVIFEELRRAAGAQGLKAVCQDFRPYYQETTRRSREAGMYRQNYCGCRFSTAEAAQERAERKAARERAKKIKQHALLLAAAEGYVNQPSQL